MTTLSVLGILAMTIVPAGMAQTSDVGLVVSGAFGASGYYTGNSIVTLFGFGTCGLIGVMGWAGLMMGGPVGLGFMGIIF